MPLSEKSIALLNQLKFIDCNGGLESNQVELIIDIFKKILSSGEAYKINEIEHWLGGLMITNPVVAERILNVAHYQKIKYDAKNPLKMMRDSCGCGGE